MLSISTALRRIQTPLFRSFSTVGSSLPNDGKMLDDFLSSQTTTPSNPIQYSEDVKLTLKNKKFTIETYGCQMNRADTNIMETLLSDCGMVKSDKEELSDIIIMNTCSVREHAESRIWNRLTQFRHLDKKYNKHTVYNLILLLYKILCVSGCMASRLKDKLLDSGVNVVVGPDSYTHLPELITEALHGKSAFDVKLSFKDEYSAIQPDLLDSLPCSQLTIMRGCNNMCSYCVVPYTRGRERSVAVSNVLREVERIRGFGYKEILLLGQNVNSYCDNSTSRQSEYSYQTSAGFRSPTSTRGKTGVLFPELLEQVAEAAPDVRIRFMSPHPKDFPISCLEVIKRHPNICQSIHLPLQSGSDTCLQRMNRPYTKQAYIDLIKEIRSILPDCYISTDIITGFCGETEEEHQETLDLMRQVKFDEAFMYLFSMRENTHAWKYYKDDVPIEVKKRRLTEIQNVLYETLKSKLPSYTGKTELILVEGESKRSKPDQLQWKGRNDGNRMCVFDGKPIFESLKDYRSNGAKTDSIKVGDYVACRIITPGGSTHIVEPLFKTSISEFQQYHS